MKKTLTEREEKLKQINKMLDTLDSYVSTGFLTRREMTDIILRRHILSMKEVLKYSKKNLG